jgi:6-phosphogluconolactonase (cycloisomerase 2 family)
MLTISAFALCLSAVAGAATRDHGGPGQSSTPSVYTETNAAAGNQIVAFNLEQNGTLVPQGSYPTGGTGTDSGLGSQGAIAASDNVLYAVNAGSDTISAFTLGGPSGPRLIGQPVASGGTDPVSLTVNGQYLYVLNEGGTPNITGFTTFGGQLTPIPGSTRTLGVTSASGEQIGISPDGRTLIVSEKGSNTIDVLAVGPHGLPSLASATISIGAGPYGFGFDNFGHLVISEAAGGSASSYSLFDGGLFPVSSSVSVDGAAPCWLVVTNDGRYAYTANAGSATISGLSLSAYGTLSLIGAPTALPAGAFHPLDEAISGDDRFLVNLNSNNSSNPALTASNAPRQLTVLALNGGTPSVLGSSADTLPASTSGLVIVG